MKRREFMSLLGGAAAAWPFAARGQQSKVARIGALYIGTADAESFKNELREGLRELGYVEGQNIAFEFRSAEGKLDRLRSLRAGGKAGNTGYPNRNNSGRPGRNQHSAQDDQSIGLPKNGDDGRVGEARRITFPVINMTDNVRGDLSAHVITVSELNRQKIARAIECDGHDAESVGIIDTTDIVRRDHSLYLTVAKDISSPQSENKKARDLPSSNAQHDQFD
jgi:hypothetical protein